MQAISPTDEFNANPVAIRQGSTEDTSAVTRLLQNHYNWINVSHSPYAIFHRNVTPEPVGRSLTDTPSVIAEADGRIIGCVLTRPLEPFVLELRQIYVDDPYRNKGVGLSLLKAIEEIVRSQHYRAMTAVASEHWFPHKQLPTNLFERSGYEVTRIIDGAEAYIRRFEDLPPIVMGDNSTGVPEVRVYNFLR